MTNEPKGGEDGGHNEERRDWRAIARGRGGRRRVEGGNDETSEGNWEREGERDGGR